MPGFAYCHGMGGYLFFQSSRLLLPRLSDWHSLGRLSPAIKLRVFVRAHHDISWLLNRQTAGPMVESRAGARYRDRAFVFLDGGIEHPTESIGPRKGASCH